ncbi:MAG TPA: sigma-70 family RNA polymerase sigma factor [Anaerolineales bacterium]|nr:sigma-70 family RNA polymerase sigma factor [Anaerolineales bacterium]
MEPGEHDLLRRAVEGDGPAFDRLVLTHTPRLYRLMRRMASDRSEAEALVQEAWLRAWVNRRRCSPEQPFFPWLARIATNAARDAWRRKRPLDFADLGAAAEWVASDEPAAEFRLEEEEAKRRLADEVERLRPEWRMVLALRYDGDLTYEQIAAALGLPLNTVRTHLRRAKIALRKRLEDGDAVRVG